MRTPFCRLVYQVFRTVQTTEVAHSEQWMETTPGSEVYEQGQVEDG